VGTGRWDERDQPLQQLVALHQDVRRPVPPAGLESQREASIGPHLEAIVREGRAGDVAAKPLEAVPVACGDGDVGMEAHPAVSNATGRDRCVWLHAIVFVCSGLDAIPETTPPLARFGSGRDPRSDGGGTEHSHQRVVADEGIVVKGDPLPLEPPQDAPGRSGENPRHVLGLGRRERREGAGVRGRSRVDAVEHERVEVGREQQSAAIPSRHTSQFATPFILISGSRWK